MSHWRLRSGHVPVIKRKGRHSCGKKQIKKGKKGFFSTQSSSLFPLLIFKGISQKSANTYLKPHNHLWNWVLSQIGVCQTPTKHLPNTYLQRANKVIQVWEIYKNGSRVALRVIILELWEQTGRRECHSLYILAAHDMIRWRQIVSRGGAKMG